MFNPKIYEIMNSNTQRDYNCKNEELPVICGFTASSLKRDLADFTAFSPQFSAEYAAEYETKIETVKELVMPQSETVALKLLTDQMYSTMDSLITPINHLTGYLDLAGKTVPLSATDFGLTGLRKGIRGHDVENVLKNTRQVSLNIAKYHTELSAVGLNGTITDSLNAARESLDANAQKKFELRSNRAAIVQSNLSLLNELYAQTQSICRIGKILYKNDNPVKTKDYTFSQLRKQVRRIDKQEDDKTDKQTTAQSSPEVSQ